MDLKESLILDAQMKKWIDVCDKLDENIQVTDSEMQKHIDTYERYLSKEAIAAAPVAGTAPVAGGQPQQAQAGLAAPGTGTPAFAARTGATAPLPVHNIQQIKQFAANAAKNPQIMADPNIKGMIDYISSLK